MNCPLAVPCPYMIFDEGHYHGCELLRTRNSRKQVDYCVCAWFYDMGYSHKEDVPKLCPRGFIWDHIDAKIKAFDPWLAAPDKPKEASIP